MNYNCISCGVKKDYAKINKYVKQQVCSQCFHNHKKAFSLKHALEEYKKSDKMYSYWCLKHNMRLKNQSCCRCIFVNNLERGWTPLENPIVPYEPAIHHSDERKRIEKYIKEKESKI
jgi:hypothetical protein